MGLQSWAPYVAIFAVFYYFYEIEILCWLHGTVGILENLLVLYIRGNKFCFSNAPLNALMGLRMRSLKFYDCPDDLNDLIKPHKVFNMSDFLDNPDMCSQLEPFQRSSEPYVIKGFVDTSNIDGLSLLQQNRDLPVRVRNNSHDIYEFYQNKLTDYIWGEGIGCAWIRGMLAKDMTVGEFVDMSMNITSETEVYYSAFDFSMARILYEHLPQIHDICGNKVSVKEIDAFVTFKRNPMPWFTDLSPREKELFGDKIRHPETAVHAAGKSNHFLQVSGRKTWTMISPKYKHRLYLWHDQKPMYGLCLGGRVTLPCVPRYQITLEPGDLLYVPPWWFHEINNIKEEGEEYSLNWAIATRYYQEEAFEANWFSTFFMKYQQGLKPNLTDGQNAVGLEKYLNGFKEQFLESYSL